MAQIMHGTNGRRKKKSKTKEINAPKEKIILRIHDNNLIGQNRKMKLKRKTETMKRTNREENEIFAKGKKNFFIFNGLVVQSQ